MEYASVLRSIDIVDVVGRYITLTTKDNNEHSALCPFHEEKTASFSVSRNKQVFHCFGCGEKGNAVSFVMKYENISYKDALHKLVSFSNMNFDRVVPQSKPTKDTENIFKDYHLCQPVPDDALPRPKVSKIDDKFIEPSFVYPYLDSEGRLLMYVYRFNLPGGDKVFKQYSYWMDKNNRGKWILHTKQLSYNKNFPLYGLDLLAKCPTTPVLVVSGEKCVEAIKWLWSDIPISSWEYIPVTWAGGDQSIEKTNWEPLVSRNKILWPDNDVSSKTCMQRLVDNYGGKIVNIDAEAHREKWDVADFIQEDGRDDIIDFIEKNIKKKVYNDTSIPAPKGIFPHKDERNKTLSSIENVQALLDYYSLSNSFNEITLDIECKIRGQVFNEYNYYKTFVARVKSVANICKLPKSDLSEFLFSISMQNKTNPVRDWIHSKKWDGVKRIKDVCDAVECASYFDMNFKNILIFKWLVSGYAAAIRTDGDGFRTRGVLVFQGKQDMGKTTFFRLLANDDRRWFGEGVNIDPSDKDTIKKANKSWITELGELDRMTSTDRNLSALKSFITNSSDELRLPYAEAEVTIWRRTIFCGTVNTEKFLRDMTGNSRFWCIPVKKIHWIDKIDIQQMWAEVRHYYEQNQGKEYLWWLSPEETSMLEITNSEYEHDDKLDDLLSNCFDMTEGLEWQEQTITEILEACGITRQYQNQSDRTKAGIKLKKLLNIDPPKRSGWGARKWRVPPYKKDDFDAPSSDEREDTNWDNYGS
ncbi:MAG: CHC2 zinc finger domain-containing protein [Candidatus Cloacimonetes bacterium]|nr:CHC2 zinc finger domain-containing protein [Candidatus Cloacimonadota bacterium]